MSSMEELRASRLSAVRSSYDAFRSTYSLRIASRLTRLAAYVDERRWRAAVMRDVLREQAHLLYEGGAREAEEACERASREVRERAMAEALEERRRVEEHSVPGAESRKVLRKTTAAATVATAPAMAVPSNNEEDEESDGNNNSNGNGIHARPRRTPASQISATNSSNNGSATMVSTSLNTMLTEAEIWDDLQLIFPEDMTRSGYPRRGAHAASGANPATAGGGRLYELRVEGGVAWYQGARFVRGDRIGVRLEEGPSPTVYVGAILSISGSEITVRPDTINGRPAEEGERARLRMALGQIRTGRWTLQHEH